MRYVKIVASLLNLACCSDTLVQSSSPAIKLIWKFITQMLWARSHIKESQDIWKRDTEKYVRNWAVRWILTALNLMHKSMPLTTNHKRSNSWHTSLSTKIKMLLWSNSKSQTVPEIISMKMTNYCATSDEKFINSPFQCQWSFLQTDHGNNELTSVNIIVDW